MSTIDDIDDMIISYLCGDINQELQGNLNELIVSDPTVRKRFVVLLDQEVQLRKIFKIENENVVPIESARDKRFMPSVRLLIAAGLVLCLGFFALWKLPALREEGLTAGTTIQGMSKMTFVLSEVRGSVTFKDGKGLLVDVLPGGKIATDTLIETGVGASVDIVADSGATKIKVDELSRFRIGLDKGVSLRPGRGGYLFEGKLSAVFGSQPKDAPFRITTSHAMAEIIGTQLTILTDDDYSKLDVVTGSVRWKGHLSRAMIVNQGCSAVSGKSGNSTIFGSPIFEEDFKDGLDGWSIYKENAKGDVVALTSKDKKSAEIIDITFRGVPVKALHLNALNLQGWLNVSLDHAITNRKFLVTFNYRSLKRSKGLADIYCIPETTGRSKVLFSGGPRLPVNKWGFARAEHTVSGNENGEFELWYKEYWVGDNLMSWRKKTFDEPIEKLSFRISVTNLELLIANIKIIPVLDSTIDVTSKTSWTTVEFVEKSSY